jgi:hypothetical protein
LSKNSPTQIFELVQAAEFPANLFLKHLVVIKGLGNGKLAAPLSWG